MSREANITSSLQITKGNLTYQSLPPGFSADVAGAKGPTPGSVSVSTDGTDVDFSQLTTPGLCRIMNQDASNFVTYGTWDPDDSTFRPLGELKPGESFILRLSRQLGQVQGVGVGTVEPTNNTLRLKADTAACNVLVEAFEV